MVSIDKRERWIKELSANLDDVVGFWMRHSLDTTHGGYYNNLDRDGSVFDRTKHVWLQGRQVWMISKLYNDVERFRTPAMLDAAKLGAGKTQSNCEISTIVFINPTHY